jgi:hypothetical protein
MATGIPIPLIGPTYTNRSLPVSAQVTRGFYVEFNQQAQEVTSFNPFPGLKPFSTGAGANRGMGRLDDVLYTVSANTLFEISSIGAQTQIGTIEGADRCKLDEDQVGNLVIATGVGKPFSYDGTTLTQGTDIDLPNASTVTYINRRMVYDGNGGDIAFADLSDPLKVNSANVIIAESKADDMKAVFAYKQQVFGFGSKTIQPLYNSGTGNPPYTFVLNATQEVGIDAIHSIGSNNRFAYFLGSDQIVYQLAGLALNPIGNPAIGQEIAKYSKTDDAYGMCFTLDNQNFYLLSFPTGNETWLFNEGAGLWTNLAFGTDGSQHLISDYQFIYNKHLVADRRNGNIYELDFETFTDNGEPIQHRRDTIAINGRTFGRAGAKVFMDRLGIEIETGTSLVTAESQIIMQYSDDNGRSWSSERFQNIGAQGEFRHQLDWFGMGSFYTRMFRFTMTDNIKWVLISADADLELDIG